MADSAGLAMENVVYANRLAGTRPEDIARAFGISEDEVERIVMARAQKVRSRILAAPEVSTALELDRVDEIQAAVYIYAKEGRKEAVDCFLKLSQHRMTLLGLHLDATRKKFMDANDGDDLSSLTDEELKALDSIAAKRAHALAEKAGAKR